MTLNKNTSTILVVEDEKPLAFAIAAKFETLGFDTVTARTVEQALDYITGGISIQAIWLDHYLLGKGTGLDFLSKLKNNKNYSDIPVFVVANTGGPDTEKSYLQLGAAKYFIKSDHRLDEIISDVKKSIV